MSLIRGQKVLIVRRPSGRPKWSCQQEFGTLRPQGRQARKEGPGYLARGETYVFVMMCQMMGSRPGAVTPITSTWASGLKNTKKCILCIS